LHILPLQSFYYHLHSPFPLAVFNEHQFYISRLTLLLVALFVALLVQLFLQRQEILDQSAALEELQHFTCPVALPSNHIFARDLTCPHTPIENTGTFLASSERSMPLAESAKRVAAEFEYSGEEVRRGVKEFLRQMGRIYIRRHALSKA